MDTRWRCVREPSNLERCLYNEGGIQYSQDKQDLGEYEKVAGIFDSIDLQSL